MTIEREFKYPLTQALRQTLHAWLQTNAEPVRTETQQNTIFDDASGSLDTRNITLRRRQTEQGEELTVKGPRIAGIAGKAREEVNLQIARGQTLQLLALLGYEPKLAYEKQTEIFRYRGALISIDQLKELGSFCEIEAEDAAAPLEEIAREVGLGEVAEETHSYPHLIRKQQQRAAQG